MSQNHKKFLNWHIIYHGKTLDSIDERSFMNYMKEKKCKYVLSIEDNTHVHIAVTWTNEIEMSNLRKVIMKHIHNDKDGSNLRYALKVVRTDDLDFTIGYILKNIDLDEDDDKYWHTFTKEYLIECKEYYSKGEGKYNPENRGNNKNKNKYLSQREIGEKYVDWLIEKKLTHSNDTYWKIWKATVGWRKIPLDTYMKINKEKLHEFATEALHEVLGEKLEINKYEQMIADADNLIESVDIDLDSYK